MRKKTFLKNIKKNKYNIYLSIAGLILAFFLIIFVKDRVSNYSLKKYENDIFIVRDKETQKSYSLKELRKKKDIKKKIKLNNGMEEVDVRGVPLEKLLGDLSYKLEESPEIIIEDSEGNTVNLPMSVALEVNRILVVYKINGKANKDYDESLGTFALIDITSKDKDSWIKDSKILNVQ